MTAEERSVFNDQGFLVFENVLTDEELGRVDGAMEEVADRARKAGRAPRASNLGIRNGVAQSAAILDLLDHPRMLSYVVDAFGWNIQNRDSTLLYTWPATTADQASHLSLGWHFDYEEEFAGVTVSGPMPLLDIKVGWYISDHREPGHATILLVRGSYKWGPEQRSAWKSLLDPREIVEIRLPPGSAMLWRPTLLHAVTPNTSSTVRKAIYVSYSQRWVRPSGYLTQDPGLLAQCSPVRRQLLGAMGDLSNPLGSDPVNNPASQYWFTESWENVPLRAWAEDRAAPPYVWGTGFGASFTKGPEFAFTELEDPRDKADARG
jgi:ectoine hydroxylase